MEKMASSTFILTLSQTGSYETTPSPLKPNQSRWRVAIKFYLKTLSIIYSSYRSATTDRNYDVNLLQHHAFQILQAVEDVGGKLVLKGLKNVNSHPGPVVFIANHMSALETFLLPAIILPFKDTTFVLKESLMSYPVFGKVLEILAPVTVARQDPKVDLRVVLDKGTELLKNGRSIIVFPQQTRTAKFDPTQFNSLGVKLAKRSATSVIPIALKTDFWENGRCIKDFGWIYPERDVFIEFGESMTVESKGKEEQESVIRFIGSRLNSWVQRYQT